MTVGTKQGCARPAEALHVDGMTNPVPGRAEPDTESFASTLQEQVVVGVAMIRLQQIVIDVLDRYFGTVKSLPDSVERT
jgi:hypothetical protein